MEHGNWILSDNGRWLLVEEVFDTGEHASVYNVEVEGDHTYFVGRSTDGAWALWAHNQTCRPGQNGKQDHKETVDRLKEKAKQGFPSGKIHENETIREKTGFNRRPDVWVEDRVSGRVVKVYEAARQNKDGSFVKRERIKNDEYARASIPSHFEPVR